MKNQETPEYKKIRNLMFRRIVAVIAIVLLILFLVLIIFTAIFSQFESFNLNSLISNGTFYLITLLSIVITLLLSLAISSTFSKPLADIADAAREVAKGNFDVTIQYNRRRNKNKKPNDIEIVFDSFNKMVAELKYNEMFKSDFISNVSHEIKTPLATIQGYATLLQDQKLPKKKREEYLTIIINATKQLTNLTSNILKLSKLENQGIFAKREEYNVAEQIRQSILALQSSWQEKDIELNIDLDEINLALDKDLMNQVWKNLFENAIKFTSPNGKISTTLKEDGDYVIATVSDNGAGMTETTKRHLFDKFYQGDNSHSKEGNGLGLALVKKILDIHGAEITVDSELNVGSTFTIKFKKTPKK